MDVSRPAYGQTVKVPVSFWTWIAIIAVALFAVGVRIGYQIGEHRTFDLIIENGRIFSGNKWYGRGMRIGITRDRIVKIGYLLGAKAEQRLDAHGRVITPGFIDTHVHIEASMGTQRPLRAANFVRMGATTLITGNCGISHHNLPEVLHALDRNGGQLNVATLVGHKTLRELSMPPGSAAEPTQAQMDDMRRILDEHMRCGALGFSTGLEYAPGIFSKPEEIVTLAKVASRWHGIYATHMRNEGTELEAALDEAIDTARKADIRLHVSHLKIACQRDWGRMAGILDKLNAARPTLPALTGDVYAYNASSSSLDLILPEAYRGFRGSREDLTTQPAECRKFVSLILKQMESQGFHDFSFARIVWSRDPAFRGLTIDKLPDSAAQGVLGDDQLKEEVPDPELRRQVRALLGLFRRGGGQMIYHVMSDADVATAMVDPFMVVGSDSSVRSEDSQTSHPRGCGNFPRVLRDLVREKRLMPLEVALHKMSTQAAETFGLEDRGVIAPGYAADLVILDPASIEDKATYDSPLEPPEGIDYVIVNGVIVADHGKVFERFPGKVLKNRYVDPGPLPSEPPVPRAVDPASLKKPVAEAAEHRGSKPVMKESKSRRLHSKRGRSKAASAARVSRPLHRILPGTIK